MCVGLWSGSLPGCDVLSGEEVYLVLLLDGAEHTTTSILPNLAPNASCLTLPTLLPHISGCFPVHITNIPMLTMSSPSTTFNYTPDWPHALVATTAGIQCLGVQQSPRGTLRTSSTTPSQWLGGTLIALGSPPNWRRKGHGGLLVIWLLRGRTPSFMSFLRTLARTVGLSGGWGEDVSKAFYVCRFVLVAVSQILICWETLQNNGD